MRCPVHLLLLSLALLGLRAALAQAAETQDEAGGNSVVVETAHYHLDFVGTHSEAEEAGRILEAAWPQFVRHFGAEPAPRRTVPGTPAKLVVRFSPDRKTWHRGIRRDGTWPPRSAGGYYWPPTRTAHLYRQPTDYFTRTLLIHEAAHQFHYLARTGNRAPALKWYTEGVAEHLSWHRWDGKTLELGVVPGLSLKDYPALALAELREKSFDMKLFVGGRTEPSRALAWALYSYLATGDEGQPLKHFEAFQRKMDAGARPAAWMQKWFGRDTVLQARLIKWLEANQAPWTQGFNQWEQTGARSFRGHAEVVTACHRKRATQTIGATMLVPSSRRWRGGLLLHWSSADDYTVALLDQRGGIQVNRRKGGRWRRLHRSWMRRDKTRQAHDFVALRMGQSVSFWIDDREIGTFALPKSPMGLALENCDLSFTDVDVR